MGHSQLSTGHSACSQVGSDSKLLPAKVSHVGTIVSHVGTIVSHVGTIVCAFGFGS